MIFFNCSFLSIDFCFHISFSGASVQKSRQSRFRVIIQKPANGGLDCPEVLSEEKDCVSPAPSTVCPVYRYTTPPPPPTPTPGSLSAQCCGCGRHFYLYDAKTSNIYAGPQPQWLKERSQQIHRHRPAGLLLIVPIRKIPDWL